MSDSPVPARRQAFGAAAIIVGNEVLTAKVVDANGPLVAKRLRARGIPLHAISTVADDVDAVVEAVTVARRRARWIITSGGIGPTHDDVTVRAVALALGRKVVRLPEMEALIREAFAGEALPAAALRLAEGPEGSTLLAVPGARFPVLTCDDIYLLPGVPRYFAAQLDVVVATLPGQPVVTCGLFLSAGEPQIAAALDAIALAFPQVAIGSYPAVEVGAPYKVKLTIEHHEAATAAAVMERLRRELPAGCVLSEEGPGSAQ